MRLIAIFTSIFISILSVSLHADDADKALTSEQLSGQVMDQKQELSARILAFRQLYPDIQNTAPRSICVWDPVGKTGPIYNLAFDRSTLMMQLGISIDLKAYTNEGVLTEDLKAGQCDAALFTGLRARSWMPLVMTGRDTSVPVAATRISHGSDVDFGSLTRNLIASLESNEQFNLMVSHEVTDIERAKDKRWDVRLKNLETGKSIVISAANVFLGAGGGALPLLQKSGIPESKGYGGFPVSGQWLVCQNDEAVKRHHAKVYGKAALGAPPMSVPHLDTRIINGKPALLFGPFAGFTTKFLKKGSRLDLIKSIRPNNLVQMMDVGVNNMDLTKYLIGEVRQSHEDRVNALRDYFPEARSDKWTLAEAGQRVQIIKKDAKGRGKLEFGTELVASKDGSMSALLGASPGASVAAQAMIEVIERCFASRLTGDWQARLKELVPSYGESLVNDADLLARVREHTLSTLKLTSA